MGSEARPVVSEAQLVDGTLLIESNANPEGGNSTLGLDPATGAVRWKHDGFAVCPQPAPEVLIACSTSSGIQRLNPATGEPLWTVTKFVYPEQSGPLMGLTSDAKRIVVNEEPEKLVEIDLETGRVSAVEGGVAWMRFINGERGKKNPNAPPGEYIGPIDPVPYDAKTKKAAGVSGDGAIPEPVGFTLEDTRIFLNANGSLQGIPAG